MSTDTYVKKKVLANGKVKYQAQVWFQGVFYSSKTFDDEGMAGDHKKSELRKILRGKLMPAAERSAQRRVEEALNKPMSHWANLYVRELAHCESRLAEYELVGRRLADKTLRAFNGKDGARFIKQLVLDWRNDRQRRSKKALGNDAPALKPLSDQTLRLRFYALMRIIAFAKDKLPAKAPFDMPEMGDLFEFTPPSAHSAPRTRQPSDAEYAQLLEQLGPETELGHFLRVIEESGCRVSEVRTATGSNTQFYRVGDEVVGGHITLHAHKTRKKVGVRNVPLSLFAAQVLHDRKLQHGAGPLFPELGDTDWVCKKFDEACKAVGIPDLLLKDFRRAFINRNKYCVAHVDLRKVVGASSLLDAKNVSQSERAVLSAVGHTNIGTMVGYSQPELAYLSQVFSSSSRWAQIAKLIGAEHAPRAAAQQEEQVDVAALQQLLAETLGKLRQAGAMGVPSNPAGTVPSTPSTASNLGAPDIEARAPKAALECPTETSMSKI